MHAGAVSSDGRGPSWDEGSAVPVLVVLEPTMGGYPWSHVVESAAFTLQVADLATHLGQESVRASLQYALWCQEVSRVVVCGEGRGWPGTFSLAALAAKAHALARVLRELELERPGAPAPPVDVAYWDSDAGELVVPGAQGWPWWKDALFPAPRPARRGAAGPGILHA
jgi:hypothetical protein